MTPGIVDPVAARRFVEALSASAPAGSRVELRIRCRAGMRQTFHCVDAIDEVVFEIARRAARTDVFVGVVPRSRPGGYDFAALLWQTATHGREFIELRERLTELLLLGDRRADLRRG